MVHNGYNHTHTNPNLPRRPRRTQWSSWSRRGNQKPYILTIPWNLASLVRNYPEIIVRQHHTDQKEMGLLKAVRRVKELTSAVLLQSGLDNERSADSMEHHCYRRIFRINFLMGRHTLWKVVRNARWRTSNTVWSNDRISLFLRKTYLDCISLEQKSCQIYFSAMLFTRGTYGKETFVSRTLKNWRRWLHLNSKPEGSMQRKC